MKKQYVSPLCEDLSLSCADLMQQSLGVLSGSGNTFDNSEYIETPLRVKY